MKRRSPISLPMDLVRPWLLVAVVLFVGSSGRAVGQDSGLHLGPDVLPDNRDRVDRPLLRARPPGSLPDPNPTAGPPPATGRSPFDPNPGPPPEGFEPVVDQPPLLVVPPAPAPVEPAPILFDGRPWSESAVTPRRTAQITGPRGVLGNPDNELALWGKETFLWPEKLHYIPLPQTLLWKVPLANQREPRFFAKFTNLNKQSYIDTAIGAQFGLGRIAPEGHENEGFQLDVFGAVFTRFNDRRLLTAADYRAGIPLTYAKGPWSTKISYEHTSTHIGDEFSAVTGRKQNALAIDEVVLGVSRYFGEHVRLYGQYGYAFLTSARTNGNQRSRFDLGISYSNYADTGVWGRPYLAYDMDLRQYQNYTVNSTFQAGWQWVHHGRSVRIGLELYDGRSPYGQFYKQSENWAAIGFYYDW